VELVFTILFCQVLVSITRFGDNTYYSGMTASEDCRKFASTLWDLFIHEALSFHDGLSVSLIFF
jgi:hypothetical protein